MTVDSQSVAHGSVTAWRRWMAPAGDLELALYEIGSGPTLLLLHGGPGDDHRYLRPIAEELSVAHRCVLYDQRGCGASRLDRRDEQTLHAAKLIEDIEAIRLHLGLERLRLFGHSWGANLALLYAAAHPDCVAAMALVGLGPLDDEARAVATANLLHVLDAEQRARCQKLSADRRQAREAGDFEELRRVDLDLMELRVRAWFYSPDAAAAFLEAYRAAPSLDPVVNFLVNRSAATLTFLDRLPSVQAPALVVYGCQDFEPITQAHRLKQLMPDVEIAFLNQCGHLPWLEQGERFRRTLLSFLAGTGADTRSPA